MNKLKEKQSINVWYWLESKIKQYEYSIFLLIFFIILFYTPFNIFSLGWSPNDDALRHVAFATVDSEWSDILVIEKGLESDHNPGWHALLKFLYNYCGFEKSDLLFFSVAGLFLLVNVCGILAVPSPICWGLAFLSYPYFKNRFLLGRPFLVSCAVTLFLIRLWFIEKPLNFFKILEKRLIKNIITIFFISLCVWVHGSWYLFFILPVSLFISGKTKESFELALDIIISTFIGALLAGDFKDFLYFHFVATYKIFTEQTLNWLLVSEFHCLNENVDWIWLTGIISFFCIKKNKYRLCDFAHDPVFIMILLCWMSGILCIRFWTDWGYIALLVWLSYRYEDYINSSFIFKNPRVRYCSAIFVLCCLFLSFVVSAEYIPYFSKRVIEQPVDFYNDATIEKLKGWEPQPGGIVYSDSMLIFYFHFYQYPNAPWKYILGFESAIMPDEDRKIFRDIKYSRSPDCLLPWINKMTEKDRLILNNIPGDYPQLEWIKANRTFYIGRLKSNKI